MLVFGGTAREAEGNESIPKSYRVNRCIENNIYTENFITVSQNNTVT